MKFQPLPLAITTGDHKGVGPEVIAKGLARTKKIVSSNQVVILGKPELYKPFKKFLPANWLVFSCSNFSSDKISRLKKNELAFLVPEVPADIGKNFESAYLCGRYIELATELALSKKVAGIVTGPIDKNELIRGGFNYDGHTGMLKSLCETPSVTMMLASPKMRVSLVTTHIGLKDVSAALTHEKIITTITNTRTGLIKLGIKKPSISVLGLNPHASDKGLFGKEEAQIIEPAIQYCKSRSWTVEGPFAADGFFANWDQKHSKKFDAIVCMYHDQGLIPIKLYDFANTVNITLGLPIIRTSVDHGVGYDIAGKNKADPSSFVQALLLANRLSQNAKK